MGSHQAILWNRGGGAAPPVPPEQLHGHLCSVVEQLSASTTAGPPTGTSPGWRDPPLTRHRARTEMVFPGLSYLGLPCSQVRAVWQQSATSSGDSSLFLSLTVITPLSQYSHRLTIISLFSLKDSLKCFCLAAMEKNIFIYSCSSTC